MWLENPKEMNQRMTQWITTGDNQLPMVTYGDLPWFTPSSNGKEAAFPRQAVGPAAPAGSGHLVRT